MASPRGGQGGGGARAPLENLVPPVCPPSEICDAKFCICHYLVVPPHQTAVPPLCPPRIKSLVTPLPGGKLVIKKIQAYLGPIRHIPFKTMRGTCRCRGLFIWGAHFSFGCTGGGGGTTFMCRSISLVLAWKYYPVRLTYFSMRLVGTRSARHIAQWRRNRGGGLSPQ